MQKTAKPIKEVLESLPDSTKKTTAKEPSEQDLEERFRRQTIYDNIVASGIPERYRGCRFQDFNISNEKQQAVVQSCVEFVEDKYPGGLVMTGKNGTGKSMLCSIILQEIIRLRPDENRGYDSHKRLYTEAIKMIRTIKDTWRQKTSEQEAIDRYIKPEILVIDEMGVQYGSVTEAQFITEIINDRYNQEKLTILSGNVTIPEITKLVGDRVIDRFRESGKTLVFNWPSYRLKSGAN